MAEDGTGGTSRQVEFPPVPLGRSAADFEQFWSDWSPLIRKVAGSTLRRARVPRGLAEVDDVVHSAYLDMRARWAADDFDGKDPGRVALGAIVRDFVRGEVDELKHRGETSRDHEDLDAPETGTSRLSDPADLYVEREVDRLLRAALPEALAELSDQQRKVLLLSAEGRTREEIAQEIGVKVGTVSPHHSRAKAKVRALLLPILVHTGAAVGTLLELLGRGRSDQAPALVWVQLGIMVLTGAALTALLIKSAQALRRDAERPTGFGERMLMWGAGLLGRDVCGRFAEEWRADFLVLRADGAGRWIRFRYVASTLWRLPALWLVMRRRR